MAFFRYGCLRSRLLPSLLCATAVLGPGAVVAVTAYVTPRAAPSVGGRAVARTVASSAPLAPASPFSASASSSFSSFFSPFAAAVAGSTALRLVTETDVLDLVTSAERAWEKALEARKRAEYLSTEAEYAAETAAAESEKVSPAEFASSVSAIGDVLNSALDAGSVLERAQKAGEEADALEREADELLRRSEEALEAHLTDFPDSPLHGDE
uniref:Uncharacterized protein n=1 Tax=Trieres chinensis TaxID=1514140 RepID=A0A7S1ZHS6_TRICV